MLIQRAGGGQAGPRTGSRPYLCLLQTLICVKKN
jgi:hypothetical protein